MPAVVLPNDKVLVTVISSYCGQTCMNTFPFVAKGITGSPPAIAAMEKLIDASILAGNYVDLLRGCMAQNCVINQVWAQIIGPVRVRARKRTVNIIGNYTETDGLTANVQASIERYGELAGRHQQGAIRVPIGTDDSCFDDGELTPAMKSALELLGNEMTQSLTVTDTGWNVSFDPCVGVAKQELDWVITEGTIVQDTVRVIRRRTVRVGI